MRNKIILFLMLLVGAVAIVRASLTAVVTPGYQFPLDGSVPPSYQLLNELAEPTITIFGTIGGSNAIAPGSITSVSLSSSVVDGTTIGFNGSTPAGMQVLAAGIIGPGLQTQSTTNFELFVDTSVFLLATNSINNTNSNSGSTNKFWLTLQPQSIADTNISPTAGIQPSKLASSTNGNYVLGSTNLGNPTPILLPTNVFTLSQQTNSSGQTNFVLGLVTNGFTSSTYALNTGGQLINISHGMLLTNSTGTVTNAPTVVRWVMVNATTDRGYVPGDEVECSYMDDNNGLPVFIAGANTTNVFITERAITPWINNKTNGTQQSVTAANWLLKCYAKP